MSASLYSNDLVRVSWDGPQRSFRYYDLFRRRADEAPMMVASHLTDTVFMDMQWNNLPWGQYSWGVSCNYEGNRGVSDTVWSAYIDKDMVTTLEVNITTNVGLPASGAVVMLSSHDGQGNSYQANADANGHLLMDSVYRDVYDVRIHLDGFVDYISDEALSVLQPTQIDVELMEAIYDVDTFYVSSTGWAMWTLNEEGNRDLQYYELMLNGVLVDRVYTDSYQLDMSQFHAGDTCLAQVRPVYLSDTCDWHMYEWIYRPCSEFSGSESGLHWSLDGETVLLSWNYPVDEAFLGAMLYREEEYIGFVEGNSFVDETAKGRREVSYCIRLVHDGPMDGTYYAIACEECATVVFPIYCEPPRNLEGEPYYIDENNYGALISWGERPPLVQQWLHYDNGEFAHALGSDNEPILFWSIRFEAEDLAEYAGCMLRKVSLFDVGAGTYQLLVYVGGETAPRTLVWTQSMTLWNTQAWHEEDIYPGFALPEDEPLWIVIGQQGLNRPAAACADQGDPNGRWVSLNGTTWTDMNNYNMHYTWMLRAFVTNRSGRVEPLDRSSYALQHYNLYPSRDNVNYQLVATVPAVQVLDVPPFYQYNDMLVGEESHVFYYRLTADYLSDDGEFCESDFAASLNDPEQQYVWIDGNWSVDGHQEEALAVYPNPTSGLITIALEGMQKVMVYNALGQALLDKECDGNALQLDLSGFENGLYWIKVMSKNGTAVRSFVLTH